MYDYTYTYTFWWSQTQIARQKAPSAASHGNWGDASEPIYTHTLGSAIELPEVLRKTTRNNAYYAVFWIGPVSFVWPEYCILCIVLEYSCIWNTECYALFLFWPET